MLTVELCWYKLGLLESIRAVHYFLIFDSIIQFNLQSSTTSQFNCNLVYCVASMSDIEEADDYDDNGTGEPDLEIDEIDLEEINHESGSDNSENDETSDHYQSDIGEEETGGEAQAQAQAADHSQTARDLCNQNNQKLTQPVLTKYEKARIIGVRANQISLGAKIQIETDQIDPLIIARQELEAGAIRMKVRRTLLNNKTEDWELSELTVT